MRRSHTKQAAIQLSERMCVAIADADAIARDTVNVPDDSPCFDTRTIRALARRGIFQRLMWLAGEREAPALTPYGRKYVGIAIEHYLTRYARTRRRA